MKKASAGISLGGNSLWLAKLVNFDRANPNKKAIFPHFHIIPKNDFELGLQLFVKEIRSNTYWS
jgi:hypothetical protein